MGTCPCVAPLHAITIIKISMPHVHCNKAGIECKASASLKANLQRKKKGRGMWGEFPVEKHLYICMSAHATIGSQKLRGDLQSFNAIKLVQFLLPCPRSACK